MLEPERYSIVVRYIVIEDEPQYRATVKELPDLAQYGKTAQEAYDLAVDAIRDLHSAASEEGTIFPEPSEEMNEYSGRITLRMPPSLHAKVASYCESDSTSLNQYIVAVLAATIGAASRPADVWNLAGNWIVDQKATSLADIQSSVTAASRDSTQLTALLLDSYSRSFEALTAKVAIKQVKMTSPSYITEFPNASFQKQLRAAAATGK